MPNKFKKAAVKEYCGTIHHKRDGRICLEYPLAWFLADESGGWSQFLNKLAVNKLYYDGGLVPEKKEAVLDAITDLYNGCVEAGASNFIMPQNPISYSDLVTALRESGVLPGHSTGPVSAQVIAPEEEALKAAHREKVKQHIAGENETENYTPEEQLAVSGPSPQDNSDTLAVEEGCLQPGGKIPILVNDGNGTFVPTGKFLELPTTGDFEVVTEELKQALIKNKDLEGKNKILEKKVMELEQECATSRGGIKSELKEEVKSAVSDGLRSLRLEIPLCIKKEVAAEVTGKLGEITTALTSATSFVVNTQENVIILKDWVNDLMGRNYEDLDIIKSGIGSLSAGKPDPSANNLCSNEISTERSSDSRPHYAPLTPDSLGKGRRNYDRDSSNIVLKPRSLTFTDSNQSDRRSRSPGRKGRSSARSRSPRRSPSPKTSPSRRHESQEVFCYRCLKTDHRAFFCRMKSAICNVCKDGGVPENLSRGHIHVIHDVKEKSRQRFILRYLPAECFPNWN